MEGDKVREVVAGPEAAQAAVQSRGAGGRGFNVNQPHGVLYFSDDNSALDATPYTERLSNCQSEYTSRILAPTWEGR